MGEAARVGKTKRFRENARQGSNQVRCNSWMGTLAMMVRKGFSEEVIFKPSPE